MPAVSSIESPDTPELRDFYATIEGASRGLGVLNVFKVMAHSPELMQSWWRMMVLLLTRLQLDPRLRELAILRLFQLKRSSYGFAHHVRESVGRIAKGMGLIPYMRHLGMEFVEGDEGFVKVRLRFQNENTTVANALHGGACTGSAPYPSRCVLHSHWCSCLS